MKKTVECLIKAYLWESQARNRYSFYASKAKKEWYEQIADIFLTTAEQEKKHAQIFYQYLIELCTEEIENHCLKIDNLSLEIPTQLGSTLDNLKASLEGETEEFTISYPKFAEIAEEEWFHEIAEKIKAIAHAEEHHKYNFEQLYNLLKSGNYFSWRWVKTWVCRECGYMVIGETAPTVCPSCNHPQGFFEVLKTEY